MVSIDKQHWLTQGALQIGHKVQSPSGGVHFGGGSSAGKVNSLQDRLAAIDRGEIPSNSYAVSSGRPQGNTLLSGTIRENLLLGNPSAGTAELERVLRIACADYVFDLPQGIDTRIGEHGYGLSEGQAQRLAIARALLRPGNVWLLDEASSALDTETTSRLMDNLLKEGAKKTLIFITHDPRLMERCSRVIHLNEQKLLENNRN